ncbi:MAG: hypothetical protein CHACPFDD_00913 [Phycisphaerae bacterium]|nr:hypothetical protein [Phycisphaerae bacterium]
MSNASPTLVSLLLCDQVIDDRLTGKKSAIGLFNMVVVPQAPIAIHQMAVLATLTELVGKVSLQLVLVRDSDNAVILESKGSITAPSPLAVVDVVFFFQGARVPSAGQYAFEVLHEGALLGRRRFQVVIHQPPPQQQQQPPPPRPSE